MNYLEKVKSGEIVELKDLVLAAVFEDDNFYNLLDPNFDLETELKINSVYAKRLEEANKQLEIWNGLSDEDKLAQYTAWSEGVQEVNVEESEKAKRIVGNLIVMRNKMKAWVPGYDLRKFRLKLDSTLRHAIKTHTYNPIKVHTLAIWCNQRTAKLTITVQNSASQSALHVNRVMQANLQLKALWESVKPPVPKVVEAEENEIIMALSEAEDEGYRSIEAERNLDAEKSGDNEIF